MKKIYSLAFALLAAATGLAQTTTLCNFDFNGSSSLPVSAASTASNITASVNSSQANAAYGGTATGSGAFIQNTTAGNALSMANSSGTNTAYWTLTLGGSALNTFMAYHLYFQSEHSSTGATVITVSYSTDGSTFTVLSQTVSPGNAVYSENFVDLSSANALNGASTIYVRFAASGASSTGTLRMDNLQVQGSLSPFETNGSSIIFNGNVTAPTLTVTGNARVNGNLTSGATSVSSLTNSGNLSVTGTSNFTGAVTTGALTSAATAVSSLTNSGNLSVTGISNLSGAVTTGALTSGAHTASSLNSTGNLGVTGTSNFTGAVTTGVLTSGATTVNSLGISSLIGSGNRRLIVNSGGNVVAGGSGVEWDQGGNSSTSPNNQLGTTDATDLIMVAGLPTSPATFVERMRILSTGNVILNNNPSSSSANTQLILKTFGGSFADVNHGLGYNSTVDGPFLYGYSGGALGTNQTSTSGGVTKNVINWLANGHVGIGTSTPYSILHINTLNTGNAPGLIVDDQSPYENMPEFMVNSNGTTMINVIATTNQDVFNIGFQESQGGNNNTTLSFLRTTFDGSNGRIGIGANSNNNGIVSTYKMFTVSGDASFANYHTGASGNLGDGETAIEVLGNDQVPTRRGVSVDSDPKGDLNFFINTNQSDGNNTTEFHFKNGAKPDYTPYSNATAAPSLMTINNLGEVIIPKLPTAVNPTGQLNSVLVDATGKLVPGSIVAGQSSTGWNVGGNSGIANGRAVFGTTDGSNLILVAGSNLINQGIGIERMRISSVDGAVTITSTSTSSDSASSPLKIINKNVGFGTNNNDHRIFEVKNNGTLYSREIWVKVDNFPDYVFKKGYKLMQLNEVENYITTNQHLPNIPSAKEVETSGQNVGEIQVKQMEKIEDLYLYVIELNKKLELLEKQNKKLATELDTLKNK